MLRREIAEGSENRCLSVIRSPATWMISAGRVNRSACNTRNTSLQQMFVVGGVLQPAALQVFPCRVCTA